MDCSEERMPVLFLRSCRELRRVLLLSFLTAFSLASRAMQRVVKLRKRKGG